MSPARLFSCAFAACALLFFSGCATLDPHYAQKVEEEKIQAAMAAVPKASSFWKEGEAKGAPKIIVNLTEQRAYFFRGTSLVGISKISTGRKGFETPPGAYRVIQKDPNHVSNLYGHYADPAGNVLQRDVEVGKDPMPEGAQFVGAPMPNFLRFTRGYGMHAGHVPRYRASHGCIRMPREMSKRFFDAAEMNTPVVVME